MTPKLALFALTLAAAAVGAEPTWVAGWLEAPLPRHSVEAAQRDAYRQRAKLPQSWAATRSRDVRFEVVAAESGAPLSGVLLSGWQSRQHTFTLEGGAAGPTPWYVGSDGAVFVTASAPGRRTSQGWVRPVGNTVRLALPREGRRTVRARTVDAQGRPAAGCAFALKGAEEPAPRLGEGVEASLLPPAHDPRAGRSDASGWIVLRLSGTATLRASLPNVGCAELAVPAQASEEWTVSLAEGGVLVAGVVVDSEGEPLAGATLSDARSAAVVTTDAEGRFRLASCLDGLYCFALMGPSEEEATDVLPSTYGDQPRDGLTIVAK